MEIGLPRGYDVATNLSPRTREAVDRHTLETPMTTQQKEVAAMREETAKGRTDAEAAVEGAAKKVAGTKIKFTAPVRRGLRLVSSLARLSLVDDAPPGPALVAKWTAAEKREYEAAIAWMEQEGR